MPSFEIGFPRLGVLSQVGGLVMHEINDDREQHQFLSQAGPEAPLQESKVIG
jgi:hypothetical protein